MKIAQIQKNVELKCDKDDLAKEIAKIMLLLKDLAGLRDDFNSLKRDFQDLKHDIDRLQQELNYFKTNDFSKLADKVVELEKMLRQLKSQFNQLQNKESAPQITGAAFDDSKLNEKIAVLEDMLR